MIIHYKRNLTQPNRDSLILFHDQTIGVVIGWCRIELSSGKDALRGCTIDLIIVWIRVNGFDKDFPLELTFFGPN